MRRDCKSSFPQRDQDRRVSRRPNKDWFYDMNEMTSLLISSVAAAFVAGALAIPITMPDAAFASDELGRTEDTCPAPRPDRNAAATTPVADVQTVHIAPTEELTPDVPPPGVCVLRIGLDEIQCCPN